MEEVWKQLSSPAFWVCTVIVGLLINLVSPWLNSRLGSLPGKWSAWAGRRSETRRARLVRDMEVLFKAPELIPLYANKTALQLAIVGFLAILSTSCAILASVAGAAAQRHPELHILLDWPVFELFGTIFWLLFAVCAFLVIDQTGLRLDVQNQTYKELATRALAARSEDNPPPPSIS